MNPAIKGLRGSLDLRMSSMKPCMKLKYPMPTLKRSAFCRTDRAIEICPCSASSFAAVAAASAPPPFAAEPTAAASAAALATAFSAEDAPLAARSSHCIAFAS